MANVEMIQYSLALLVGVLLSYQLMLRFHSLRVKKAKDIKISRNRKFAIVLPATKDEKSISRSLYSLSGLVYPKNLYDLVVITDYSLENSAEIADKLGATVLSCPYEIQKKKNKALRWAFDQILQWNEGYDAIIIFDTDSLVSGNYLEVMNYYLENGSKVIQSSDWVLPHSDPGRKTFHIRYWLFHYIKLLDLEWRFRCNGVCFSVEVIRTIPWQSWAIFNEVDLGLELQLQGIDIEYAPEAELRSQNHAKSTLARKKEINPYLMIRRYVPKLIGAFFRKRKFKYLGIAVNQFLPSLITILPFTFVMAIANALLWGMGWTTPIFFWMWSGVLLLGLLNIFVGLMLAGVDWHVFKSFSFLPSLWGFWGKVRGKSDAIESPQEQQIKEDSKAVIIDN